MNTRSHQIAALSHLLAALPAERSLLRLALPAALPVPHPVRYRYHVALLKDRCLP